MTSFRPNALRVVCAVALILGATNVSNACCCLFSWLFPPYGGYGYGAYYPPAYNYGPACCTPCDPCRIGAGGCSPCAVGGCSPCGVGGCATGTCGVGYLPRDPIPDGTTGHRTYSTESESSGGPPRPAPAGRESLPKDDFGAPRREGENDGTGTENDPFKNNPSAGRDRGVSPRAVVRVRPLNLDRNVTVRIVPARQRLQVEARYRVPQVARVNVAPSQPRLPAPAGTSLAHR
jgi:hypothetical protein